MSVFVPPRRLLFGPGPTQIPQRVYDAMCQPIVGHLDPFFFEIVEEIRKQLAPVWGTKNDYVHVLSGTGSAGMEASLINFVEPGQKLAVFVGGYFADRIAEMGKRHGAVVVRYDKPWGETVTEAEAAEFLERERPQAVAFVHAETSTGALQDPQAITRPAHAIGALTISDCVTSLGAMPICVDAAGIDVAFSCTQKGLSCPPGLSPICLSSAAMERLNGRKHPCPIWYLDLKLLFDYYGSGHRYHHTAPISNFYALREGLAIAHEEGLEQRFARHQKAHETFVRRIELINLKMFIPEGRRIPHLNTVQVPEGVDDVKARKRLVDEFGIDIAGGFGPLAGKIFRMGLIGPFANEDSATMLVGALVHCLRD